MILNYKYFNHLTFFKYSFRDTIVAKLDQQISGNIDVENFTFCISAGTIYFNEASYETVLKVLHQSEHLEW